MKSRKREPLVIGWNEVVALPDWDIPSMRAKIDTGARTSALHVRNVKEIEGGAVQFDVVLEKRPHRVAKSLSATIYRRTYVRSSTGTKELRYIVKTKLTLGNVEKDIQISLASRDSMVFRMLLGRQALKKDFLVDVSRKQIASKPRST